MKERRKVLIVMHDPLIRELLRRVLSSQKVDVVAAGDAQEALCMMETNDLDLVFIDDAMQCMSGRALAKAVSNRNPSVRIFSMSGYSSRTVYPNRAAKRKISFILEPLDRDVQLR